MLLAMYGELLSYNAQYTYEFWVLVLFLQKIFLTFTHLDIPMVGPVLYWKKKEAYWKPVRPACDPPRPGAIGNKKESVILVRN